MSQVASSLRARGTDRRDGGGRCRPCSQGSLSFPLREAQATGTGEGPGGRVGVFREIGGAWEGCVGWEMGGGGRTHAPAPPASELPAPIPSPALSSPGQGLGKLTREAGWEQHSPVHLEGAGGMVRSPCRSTQRALPTTLSFWKNCRGWEIIRDGDNFLGL